MSTNLSADWQNFLGDELEKPYFIRLQAFVASERKSKRIYPTEENVFAAFNMCPLNTLKGVILGQDPYHGEGQATGLSFSVPPGCKLPPSLRNIYKELAEDLKLEPPKEGSLTSWASQGLLLLNTTLTVRQGEPLSHAHQGWETFTSAVLSKLIKLQHPLAFILWGNHAKQTFYTAAGTLPLDQHLILKSAHPSPFSAKAFLGTKPFSQLNNFLKTQMITPINFNIR